MCVFVSLHFLCYCFSFYCVKLSRQPQVVFKLCYIKYTDLTWPDLTSSDFILHLSHHPHAVVNTGVFPPQCWSSMDSIRQKQQRPSVLRQVAQTASRRQHGTYFNVFSSTSSTSSSYMTTSLCVLTVLGFSFFLYFLQCA